MRTTSLPHATRLSERHRDGGPDIRNRGCEVAARQLLRPPSRERKRVSVLATRRRYPPPKDPFGCDAIPPVEHGEDPGDTESTIQRARFAIFIFLNSPPILPRGCRAHPTGWGERTGTDFRGRGLRTRRAGGRGGLSVQESPGGMPGGNPVQDPLPPFPTRVSPLRIGASELAPE